MAIPVLLKANHDLPTRTSIQINAISSKNIGSIQIRYREWGTQPPTGIWNKIETKSQNGRIEWNTALSTPLTVEITIPGSNEISRILLEPGDAISLHVGNQGINATGTGSEKINLDLSIKHQLQKLSLPETKRVFTMAEFHLWNKYLDSSINIITKELNLAEKSLKKDIYTYIKSSNISAIEYIRTAMFHSLHMQNTYSISADVFCKIYDSLIVNPQTEWLNTVNIDADNDYFYYLTIAEKVERNKRFSLPDSAESSLARRVQYYQEAVRYYKGDILSNVLFKIIGREGFHKYGFTKEVDSLLEKYYQSTSISSEDKAIMRKYELETRAKKTIRKVPKFPPLDSAYYDQHNSVITKKQLAGRIVLLNFYDPKEVQTYIPRIENYFRNNDTVIVANIAVDGSHMNANNQKNGISWRFPATVNDSILKYGYGVTKIPSSYLFNHTGRPAWIFDSLENKADQAEQIIREIDNHMIYMSDGPYVKHTEDSVIVTHIETFNISNERYSLNNPPLLKVITDRKDEHFLVKLKKYVTASPSISSLPSKMVVISDIEGNFKAFRELLQANHVIDDHLNWIFKDGHLVLVGDFFDRGQQVAECLWLIYHLENQSVKHQGQVHFILGNHELMNLTGDTGYVRNKYIANAGYMQVKYTDLYSKDTEIGKWLRTKNIVEKIGNILFVHGGISKDVLNLKMPLEEINTITRRYMNNREAPPDSITDILTNNSESPFWYRGYYQNFNREKIENVIDQTLTLYQVEKIITGHTLTDDISDHYNGKIINIDTPHAFGKSQALLIENGIYYSVDNKGNKNTLPHKIP